jgi:hypothetical protein
MEDPGGAVSGNVRFILQLEGAATLAVATWLYTRTDSPWWVIGPTRVGAPTT